MRLSGDSEIQQLISDTLAQRPYSHDQTVRDDVVAVITVERDMRFFPDTLGAVLQQSVLPSTIVIADCSGQTLQSVQTSFKVIPTQADALHGVPQEHTVHVQVLKVAQARSFGDAVAKVLRNAQIDTTVKTLWLLHDDSRPADPICLERLLDTWTNTPTAALIGCKQLDWDAVRLHDVGKYSSHHAVASLVVDGEPDQEQYDSRSDVFAVSLAGALIPVNTWRSVHGINAWFTTYDESADFCRRLCRAGKRVVVVPSARIAHRRARFEGIRTHDGQPTTDGRIIDTSMPQLSGEQKYLYTDVTAGWWPLLWVGSVFACLFQALRLLFRKQPYRAWCMLCMPVLALLNVPPALVARHRLKLVQAISRSQLSNLVADRAQLKIWNARSKAFADEQGGVVLDPLAQSHLHRRLIRRWTYALLASVVAFLCLMVMYWPLFGPAFAGGSLYSNQLPATDATFRQLVEAATTTWNFGAGTGVAAPPAPWLLVLMVASVFTGGHVAAAVTSIFFLSAPACVLSFWALAGVVTRSDEIRVFCGLLWFATALSLGLYSSANLPMLTVMVFLPGAFALCFKAVGMYRTEQPVNPRASVQAAAAAALMFIPAVAAEPQLLLALIVVFVAFLVFVRQHRMMLVLIPFPSAFAIAPTLVNAVRYAGNGMMRQLFGDVMVPVEQVNGAPRLMNLSELTWQAFGIAPPTQWGTWFTLNGARDAALFIAACLITMLAVLALLRPSVFRASRILWTVSLCGLLLAMVSAAVVIAAEPYGLAAGSVLPGIAMALCGIIANVAVLAGAGTKQFTRLATEHVSKGPVRVAGRVTVAVVLAVASFAGVFYGYQIAYRDGIGQSDYALPQVAQEYLHADANRRILALEATGVDTIEYAVMRTGSGDLIDSSPAQRAREAVEGFAEDSAQTRIARAGAQLLAQNDDDAIVQLSDLGFGGIYVVTDGHDASGRASAQLLANITSCSGVQSVVSNAGGTYYRLTLNPSAEQHIDDAGIVAQTHNPWRIAWLWCLGVIVFLYCVVAIPRTHAGKEEEA